MGPYFTKQRLHFLGSLVKKYGVFILSLKKKKLNKENCN